MTKQNKQGKKPTRGIIIGIDVAEKDGDFTSVSYWRNPNIFEKLLRKIGLSKAAWTRKLVKIVTLPPENKDNL